MPNFSFMGLFYFADGAPVFTQRVIDYKGIIYVVLNIMGPESVTCRSLWMVLKLKNISRKWRFCKYLALIPALHSGRYCLDGAPFLFKTNNSILKSRKPEHSLKLPQHKWHWYRQSCFPGCSFWWPAWGLKTTGNIRRKILAEHPKGNVSKKRTPTPDGRRYWADIPQRRKKPHSRLPRTGGREFR